MNSERDLSRFIWQYRIHSMLTEGGCPYPTSIAAAGPPLLPSTFDGMAMYAKGSPYTGAPFDMIRILTGRTGQAGNC